MPTPKSFNDTDVFVGRRIRALRLERRISQERLSTFLGLTFQQVQKYEKGTNRVSASVLFETAKALGVEVAAFFPAQMEDDETVPAKGAGHLFEVLATPGGAEMLESYLRLPTPARRQVAGIVHTIADCQPEVVG